MKLPSRKVIVWSLVWGIALASSLGVAAAFPLRTQTARTVTIMPGVPFVIGSIHVSFASNKVTSLVQVYSDSLVLDHAGIGGYGNSTVTISVLNWTLGLATVIRYAVSAAGGTHAHLNATGAAIHVSVDGTDHSSDLQISGNVRELPWSSWSSSHIFLWTLQPLGGAPNTINGQDISSFLWNFLLIFGFIAVVTLGLIGAYRLRQMRGGA